MALYRQWDFTHARTAFEQVPPLDASYMEAQARAQSAAINLRRRVRVFARPLETLSSVASRALGDPAFASRLATFNHLSADTVFARGTLLYMPIVERQLALSRAHIRDGQDFEALDELQYAREIDPSHIELLALTHDTERRVSDAAAERYSAGDVAGAVAVWTRIPTGLRSPRTQKALNAARTVFLHERIKAAKSTMEGGAGPAEPEGEK